MLRAKQIVNGLHGVECFDGHLYKHGTPIAHRSVPKTGKLKSLQLTAALALRADEACRLVHESRQVKLLTLIVACAANQVNGVKVGSILEHRNILVVCRINLARFQDLERNGSVGVVAEEGAATRLTHVLDTRASDG